MQSWPGASARRAANGALSLLLLACGGAATARRESAPALDAGAGIAPAEPVLVPAAAPPPDVPRRSALRFELDGRPFPSPLIDAVVAGKPATLLVDTGASHHVLARWLAEELAVPLGTAGDIGIDHAGQRVQVSRIERASLTLPGWGPVHAPTLLVVPVPHVLRRIGIGGFLSPQSLAANGRAVVLDLRAGEMREAPHEQAIRDLKVELGEAALIELGACGGPNQGLELTAAAHVEGLAVTLKIDSGASQSSLFAVSPAGMKLAPRAAGGRSAYAASGKHEVPVLPRARVRFGGLDMPADIDLLPGAPRATCPTDGFAGMDLLRGCVLVLSDDGGVAACARR